MSRTVTEKPWDFVSLFESLPEVIQESRYYTTFNFIGDRIDGYESPCAFLTIPAATALKGETKLEALTVENIATKEQEELTVSALFTAVGHDPETAPLAGLPVLDDNGAVAVEKDCSTAVPGLFAAGDVTKGAVRQIVSAADQGMQAFLSARKYLRTLK